MVPGRQPPRYRDHFNGVLPMLMPAFLRRFRDPIPVPGIENRVPRFRENYHRAPRIREIRSLQVYTGYLTFSLKKTANALLLFH